jgi:hypothetical protein
MRTAELRTAFEDVGDIVVEEQEVFQSVAGT